MTRRIFAVLCGSALPVLVLQGQSDDARAAAEKWLALADQGKFQECYQNAGKTFREQATYTDWEHQMHKARTAEGAFKSRKFVDQKSTRQLAGSPDGEYVVFHYAASFAQKPSAKETIVMGKEDGAWKFAGYVIQ